MPELTRASRSAALSVLFPPKAVFVLDIFRALGDFEEHYDVDALDALEGRLSQTLPLLAAKALVSDALLFAFGLRRERREELDFSDIGSRRGTADEYKLMVLIGAAGEDDDLATRAALALKVANPQLLVLLAGDLSRQLDEAGFEVEIPDGRTFAAAFEEPGASPVEPAWRFGPHHRA